MKILIHILMIPVYILTFFFSGESTNESNDSEYQEHRENQIDVETGEVISVVTKRVGL